MHEQPEQLSFEFERTKSTPATSENNIDGMTGDELAAALGKALRRDIGNRHKKIVTDAEGKSAIVWDIEKLKRHLADTDAAARELWLEENE